MITEIFNKITEFYNGILSITLSRSTDIHYELKITD